MRPHTPGPWTVLHDSQCGRPLICAEDVAIADLCEREGGETQANASLIAASPRLLVMLKYAVARLCRVDGGDSITVSNALDAIHEATGETFDVEAFIAEEDAAAKAATADELLAAAKRTLAIHEDEACSCFGCRDLRAAIAKMESKS